MKTLIRAHYASGQDFRSRIPELRPLENKCAAVFGLGSIGAPVAMELARAGIGRLNVLDTDTVDADTACRWPVGLSAAGRRKVDVIEEWVKREYPWTRAKRLHHRIGGVCVHGERGIVRSDFDVLDELGGRADILIDATAEFGVQHFLSDWAREHQKAYLSVTGTQGGWGGEIVRIRPGKTQGCWMCCLAAQTRKDIPDPPEKKEPGVQPRGCGDPTFTGSGFDMLQVAVLGVRIAISTLCEGAGNAYPGVDEDVFIISLRNETGAFSQVNVLPRPLVRDPDCPRCRA